MAAERAGQIAPGWRRWRRLGPWLALAPALGLVGLLFGSSIVNGLAQSLGYLPYIGQRELRLDAYRDLLGGANHAARFWESLLFSLWVTGAATVLSALGALGAVAALGRRLGARRGRAGGRGMLLGLNLNFAFPHLVWAIGLLLLLSQSGVLSRLAAALGLIDRPAAFPVLVRDTAGLGIIIHYVTKETPFLLLMALAALRAQTEDYALAARTLGASPWQELRYVTLPLVWPALLSGSLLVFAYVFGAYEVPALLGVQRPRMLAVLSIDFFRDADLRSRAAGMAVSVLMAAAVLLVALLARRLGRRGG